MDKQRRYFVCWLILFSLALMPVEKSSAGSLGLEEGNYNITLDFDGTYLGRSVDATGVISIGQTAVTFFHIIVDLRDFCFGEGGGSCNDLPIQNAEMFRIGDQGIGPSSHLEIIIEYDATANPT